MIATVHPAATDAGTQVLAHGGNAIDAAVAAALTLGVVDGFNSGIGGGCFILVHLADGRLVAIDGRETAPQLATVDMFLQDGVPCPRLSQVGALAVGVPGALAAYYQAVAQYGHLTLAELLLPAAQIAERGFPVTRAYAANIERKSEDLARFSGSRAVLLKQSGVPYQAGEILRQVDLARTYRAIAKHGARWFYAGPFARAVDRWMVANGGLLRESDFANYRAVQREPIVTRYHEYTVVGFPPPSSGGVHVAQILNLLERFDLKQMHNESPGRFHHVLAESMKLAFADRAHWLGDPGFAKIPRGLTAKEYANQLAHTVDWRRAGRVVGHGKPPRWQSDFFDKHTTHVAAADSKGNWVALTATINTTFGSKVIVPGTGVILNNEMDDFSIAPGTPNAYGLVGSSANAIAPGKRPLSSMSPTIVFRTDPKIQGSGTHSEEQPGWSRGPGSMRTAGRPIMTLGAAGGPTIITQVVQTMVRYLDLEMDLPSAVGAPRIHHQWLPNALVVERSLDADVAEDLRARGHSIKWRDGMGVTQAIGCNPEDRTFIGAHDPRVSGKAAGPSVER